MIRKEKIRCPWVDLSKQHYKNYHDREWGKPVHNDRKHFEMLTLEGAQAGLSWETILKRRKAYKEAFFGFDVKRVAKLTDAELETLLLNHAIIRNRLKIFSTRKNAQVVLEIQKEFQSFDNYVWRFVLGNPKINLPRSLSDIKSHTKESKVLAKDLKKRGMSFVGPTIIYAYMQAVGLVNDHTKDCFLAPEQKQKMQSAYA